MLASSTFILIRNVLRLLHFSLLLLFVYLFQPGKLWNLFRLALGAPHCACTNSGFSLLEFATIIISICVPFTWNLVIIINMRFYYLPVKPNLQIKPKIDGVGDGVGSVIYYMLDDCWPHGPWPMTHVGRPLTHLTSFHFNLDPGALLRMTTGDEIGFHFYFSIMCRSEVKSPKTSTNCKQVFKRVTFKSCFFDRSL